MPPLLIDLHCHLLPGIDDGAKDLDMTMTMLRKEQEDGVDAVVFTPHFYYERMSLEKFAHHRAKAYRQTASACRKAGIQVAARLGAEVFFTPALPSLDLSVLAFSGTRYLLMELPTTHCPAGVEDVLFALQQQGYTPILAHVERYPYVTENPMLLYNWVTSGAIAQINGSGLVRGGQTARLLHKYIQWNLVHLLCTDAHNMNTRQPNLRQAHESLPEAHSRRFKENGEAVFWDRPLIPEEPVQPRYRFGQWI